MKLIFIVSWKICSHIDDTITWSNAGRGGAARTALLHDGDATRPQSLHSCLTKCVRSARRAGQWRFDSANWALGTRYDFSWPVLLAQVIILSVSVVTATPALSAAGWGATLSAF